MPIENRQFLRFSLDIPTFYQSELNEQVTILVKQISIGGCLIEWTDLLKDEEDFRVELVLPNNNRLPLQCKTIYRLAGHSVGVKFINISRFEQDLLAAIISDSLEKEGLPLVVDPFSQPPPKFKKMVIRDPKKNLIDDEAVEEEMTV